MKTKTWIIVLSLLFAVLCVLSVFLLFPKQNAENAEIWSEGRLLYRVSLHEDAQFVIESSHGSNTVTVKNGKIAVTQATCPDRYCMKRGACSAGADIICLPNQLVIKFSDKAQLDATSG